MATTASESKSNGHPKTSEYEAEIRAEMAEIRNDIAALAKSVGGYGKVRATDLQDRATEMSDEVLNESRRALKKLGKQVASLEKDMEVNVREHPLHWFLGALGVGMVFAMLVRRGE
jgi:ElaB/YqjD/DUF883 family membrane-anchored ribosome-binding protein